MIVESGFCSEKGSRSDNEDCVRLDDDLGVYLLADGTGGRAQERTASSLACESIWHYIDERRAALRKCDPGTTEVLLSDAVARAHGRILDFQRAEGASRGIATTLVLVLWREGRAHVGHVGDSRLYRWRHRRLECLTRDHSLENYLADHPELTSRVARSGKTLVRALGLEADPPDLDHKVIDTLAGDILLLCSDGVTEALPEWLIREIMAGAEESSASEVADAVVRAALRHGSADNVSAAVLATRPAGGAEGGQVGIEGAPGAPFVLGWLAVVDGPRRGAVVQLPSSFLLGAAPACDLIIDDDFASKEHAQIFALEEGFVIRDLQSSNGTYVNRVRVSEHQLSDTDAIRIGRTTLVFRSYPLAERQGR